jgi:hypothetical protein
MALDGSPNFVVLRILAAGRDKAPLPRTVEAGSFFMHDSNNFQWMKFDVDVLSLTGFASNQRSPFCDNRKTAGAAEPYRRPAHS